MYAANRFPVLVYDRDARAAYKGGGLAAKARDVADAGRFSDTKIIHVTDDEFNMLRNQWGEPTINPHTGMHEFGIFGSILKVLKTVAPIAVSFIPGVGPFASAALGAGLGALDGGGIKGAVLGGITGGLGAGGMGGIGAKLGTSIGGKVLGQTASTVAKNALGQAVIQGALGAAAGRDPLASAASGAALGALSAKLNPDRINDIVLSQNASTGANSALDQIKINAVPAAATPTVTTAVPVATTAATAPAAAASDLAAKPNFFNRDFLGLGIAKNKYAIPAILGAAALADALKPKDKTSMPTQSEFFDPTFNAQLDRPGGFQLASVASGLRPESIAAEYAKKYFSGYAGGGDVGENRGSFAVHGAGTGRSDDIPAMLSDGEYVMDAETVSLLGDGSTKAGAKKLDDFRVKIRKQKGRKLAKGKISHDAKPAERYMAGGRI